MPVETRIVVEDNSTNKVVRRRYYPEIGELLTNDALLYTHGKTNPRFVSEDKAKANVPKVDNPFKKVARVISNLAGVIEVILDEQAYSVRLRPPFDWSQVDRKVIEAIQAGLELGSVKRIDFPSWRATNSMVAAKRPRPARASAKQPKAAPKPKAVAAPKAAKELKAEGFTVVKPTKSKPAGKTSPGKPAVVKPEDVTIVKSMRTSELKAVRTTQPKPAPANVSPPVV